MKFVDYLDENKVREIASDAKKLKKLAKEDNGFILKKMEELGVFPNKEVIEGINTAASVIFLFNHYDISNEELFKYSRNFKDGSIVVQKINEKVGISVETLIDVLTNDSAAFVEPGFLLSKQNLIKYQNELLKIDLESDDKGNYFNQSIQALSVNDMQDLPISLFSKCSSVYNLHAKELFSYERHVKHFKQITARSNSFDIATTLIYMEMTGDLSGINNLDSYSSNFVASVYDLKKEYDPSFTMTDLFKLGNNHIKEIILSTDLSDDFDTAFGFEHFYKDADKTMDVFVRFNKMNVPVRLKSHVELCSQLESYKRNVTSFKDVESLINQSPKTYLGGFYRLKSLLEDSWEEYKDGSNKIKDNDGKRIGTFELDELRSVTTLYFNRVLSEKVFLSRYIPDILRGFLLTDMPNSLNKAILLLAGSDKEKRIDLMNGFKGGLDKETLKELKSLISNKDYYKNGGKLGSIPGWYGSLDNLYRNKDGLIEWDETSMAFFGSFGQGSFIKDTYMSGKAIFSSDYLNNEIRKTREYGEYDISDDLIKFAATQENASPEMKVFVKTLKSNAIISYKIWGLPNETEIVADLLTVFSNANDFINEHKDYFFRRINSDDEYYYDEYSINKRDVDFVNLFKDIERVKSCLKGVSSEKKSSLEKMLSPKNYNQAFLIEILLGQKDVKRNFLIADFNKLDFDFNLIDRKEFSKLVSKENISKTWRKLNKQGKSRLFKEMVSNLKNSDFYSVFKLFNYENPKNEWDNQCKQVILDIAPEKIFHSKYNFDIKLNMETLFELTKAITKNKSWNHNKDINSRFVEFLERAWEESTVAEYENVLERAKKEDPASYSLLLGVSKFYGYSFSFKDNQEDRNFPFTGFEQFDKEQKEKYPEEIKLDYNDRPKHVPYLSFFYNKIDLDVAVEGINKIREDFIAPIIKQSENEGYSDCLFKDKTMSELFPLFVYIDYPMNDSDNRIKISEVSARDKEIAINFVDKLLDKDVANINLIMNCYYLPQIYGIDNLIDKVMPKVVDVDSFRKVVLMSCSEGFSSDGSRFYQETATHQQSDVTKRNYEFVIGCVKKLFNDPDKLDFLGYSLDLNNTHDKNFKRLHLSGAFHSLDSAFSVSDFGSIEKFREKVNDLKFRLRLKNSLNTHISELPGENNDSDMDSDLSSGSDYGFKL